ncbi:hypothetical protein Trisim1_000806 [Trichoderma cf. simile WF8]
MESGESLHAARPNSSAWGSSGGARVAPRIRSRVACQPCNQRKVRCDVVQTGGNACSNCQRDGGSCVVLPRKKHRPRRKRDSQFTSQKAAADTAGISYNKAASGGLVDPQVGAIPVEDPPEYPYGETFSASLPSSRNNVMGVGEPQGRSATDTILPEDGPFTYIGDRRGPRHSVYDLCHPETPEDARYLPPDTVISSSHKPHELEYMRLQGVFSRLPDDVCDELIRCYFHHVHFFLPIIDAPAFLNEYCSNGSRNISLLLYWSILLAAANFVDADVLQKAGFSSRKAMKTAMYERAKCLYDFDRGTEKLVLIQSVILLGFWYTDPQDHTGAWYWIGIAISLSQNIGLHRSSRLGSRVSQKPLPARESLMRRIWWACVVRDRWVSLARGRPMRIHSEDCDTPLPVVEDIMNELESVVGRARSNFVPVESRALAEMWIRLVRICDTLGHILRVHYCVNGGIPSITEIDRYAQELQALAQEDAIPVDSSESLTINGIQIDLLYQATIAILYRPYVLNRATPLPSGAHSLWQKIATSRAREAASNTNGLLQSLIEVDGIRYLKPMMITAMIPAMQIHLYDCKSSNALTRGLAENKLQLHMLVLSNLRETYWSADVTYRLFDRAQNILKKSNSQVEKPPVKNADNSRDSTHLQQSQPQLLPPTEPSLLPTPEPTVLVGEQQYANTWFNGSPQFRDVDQLLSPGFYLSEDGFSEFLLSYEDAVVYDPLVLG